MNKPKDTGIIEFTPAHWWQRLVRKIVDHRITMTATADAVGKGSKSIITIVYYARWQRAIYILGRRING